MSRRTDSSILLTQELLSFCRPRHQLTIQTDPIRFKLFPQPIHRSLNSGNERRFQRTGVEEPSARSRVTDARQILDNPEASPCSILIATNNHDGTRTHVLLFANDARNALMPEVSKRLGRVFEQIRLATRLRWRHRWRQIDQPLRIGRKPAHHFESGNAVLFPDRYVPIKTRGNNALAGNVLDIKNVVVFLLRG